MDIVLLIWAVVRVSQINVPLCARYYCNGDALIMKVLETQETSSGQIYYDVVFADPSGPRKSAEAKRAPSAAPSSSKDDKSSANALPAAS